MAVPVHHRHGLARRHAQARQRAAQPAHALAELPVGQPGLAAIDDFLIGILPQRGDQQVFYDQLVVIGAQGRFIPRFKGLLRASRPVSVAVPGPQPRPRAMQPKFAQRARGANYTPDRRGRTTAAPGRLAPCGT